MSSKKVLQNSFFYSLSSILVKAFGFVLLPIYTIYLSPEQYGIVNLSISFTNVAVYVVALSVYSSVIRFYVDFLDDNDKKTNFFSSLIIFIIVMNIVFVLISVLFRDNLISLFFNGVSFMPYVFVSIISIVFISEHTLHQNILKASQNGKKLSILNLIVFSFQAGLTILFVVVFKLQAFGVLLSILITNFLYFVYMIFDLSKHNMFRIVFDKGIMTDTLKYSIPLVPHNTSTNIADLASKVFINSSGQLSSVGIYGVGATFGSVIDTLQISFNQAFVPWLFGKLKTEKEVSYPEIIDFSYSLLTVYTFIYLLVGLFAQEVIIILLNVQYHTAWKVVPILVVGYSAKSIYYFYANLIFYYKEATKRLFIVTVTGSLIEIIVAFSLIERIGIYGAALAFVIGKIFFVIIVSIICKKYNIGYQIWKMLQILIPSLIFLAIGLYYSYMVYPNVINLLNVFYKCLIVLIYLGFVILTNRKKTKKMYGLLKTYRVNRKKTMKK